MPESEDMVGLIVEESSEESGPIKETAPAQGDDAASSQEGTTAAPVTPSVEELQAQLSKVQAEKNQAFTGFRTQQASADRAAAELRRYHDAEARAIQEQFKDKDAWIETVTDPEKYAAFQQRVLSSMIQQALDQRDYATQYTQEQDEGMKAMGDLRNFAEKEAKMNPDQFAAFLYKNSPVDARTGQRLPPFHGYSPQEALRMAKALIRDEHFEHFAAKVREQEQKDADSKAKRQNANALPSGVPAGGGKSQEAESFEDRYKSAIATASSNNPRDWLSH